MTTYFISDLHLSEHEPQTTELFLQFFREKAPLADAVYILGDLFDVWIGDDEQSNLISTVKYAIRKVTEQGVPCYFIRGNRDFLIGKRFANECGLQILPDYHLIDLYGERVLLCHGDTLCTDDVLYQKFRRKVHRKFLQQLFLYLPLSWRLKIAEKIRAKSNTDKITKPEMMMDVNEEFTGMMVADFDAQWLIHGHTHKQAVHFDSFFTRIVLGDWGNKPSILIVTPDGFDFEGSEDDFDDEFFDDEFDDDINDWCDHPLL